MKIRHKGTKAQRHNEIKRIMDSFFPNLRRTFLNISALCAFVPLCLCACQKYFKNFKCVWLALMMISSLAGALIYADTIVLMNGGKLKCKEIIQSEEQVICKFDESQLIIKKEKIKEIIASENTELYQNVSNESKEKSNTSAEAPPSNTPEDMEKKIQELENSYDKNRTEKAKNELVNAYNRATNIMYQSKNYRKAIEYALKLEKLAPNAPTVKLKLAYCNLMISDLFMAEHYAKAAKNLDKNYADAYFLLGEIYYHQNYLNEALYEWQMGLKIQPNQEYEEKLNKLSKEMNVAVDHLKTNTRHFKITFDGTALDSNLVNPVINILEDHYKELSIAFNYYPTDPITVIFYSNQDFREVIKAPYWSTGIYDGKIRIPAKNIKLVKELSPLLKHELVHAIVSQKTNYNAPTWLEEGLAEFYEGENFPKSSEIIEAPSLFQFPESWSSFKADEIKILYGKSLSFINFLQEQYGMWKILMLLDTLAEGKNIEEAFQKTYIQSLSEVEQQWSIHIMERP